MGQKVNPHGLRVGIIKDWDSRWYAEDAFADNLVEDDKIRKYVKKRLYNAGISKIEIERASDRVKLIVYTAKPGVVIGKGGAEIERVSSEKEIQKFRDSLQPGMEVITYGGIHGTIKSIDNESNTVMLEIASDVKIKVEKTHLFGDAKAMQGR